MFTSVFHYMVLVFDTQGPSNAFIVDITKLRDPLQLRVVVALLVHLRINRPAMWIDESQSMSA